VNRLYRATRRTPNAERCELCAAPLDDDHDHLYEARVREIRCACRGCVLIIPTAQASPYRRVPKRFDRLPIDARAWLDRLGVPVGIAALIRRDSGAVLAYPGPVGLVEAATPSNELVDRLVPEVEAIVLSNVGVPGAWISGIDVVFRMITEVRKAWVGLAGGPDAPAAVARVLAELAG
jgi:hypothetical protein